MAQPLSRQLLARAGHFAEEIIVERKPGTPLASCFLLCSRIIRDEFTKQWMLCGPTEEWTCDAFPAVVELSVFAKWTSVHGTYRVELQVRDMEGNIVSQAAEPLLQGDDPLRVLTLALLGKRLHFPGPGKYDIVLLANNEEVSRTLFTARLPHAPTA